MTKASDPPMRHRPSSPKRNSELEGDLARRLLQLLGEKVKRFVQLVKW